MIILKLIKWFLTPVSLFFRWLWYILKDVIFVDDRCKHLWSYKVNDNSKMRKCQKCGYKQKYNHYYKRWEHLL